MQSEKVTVTAVTNEFNRLCEYFCIATVTIGNLILVIS